ncbi:hypothetical protein ACM44_01330 [Chryseobacterium koreense CCUG 49689]|uniref:Uncharacterized protein n=1 Tax=Chryseobacterium koreense CCUG 49689 TaxID=1304281 RepID=A0A0J7J2A3_9FLAO|nr:hypothetical protein ACM44_01330 [Chryseobacterium koreense CCUG 49689]
MDLYDTALQEILKNDCSKMQQERNRFRKVFCTEGNLPVTEIGWNRHILQKLLANNFTITPKRMLSSFFGSFFLWLEGQNAM